MRELAEQQEADRKKIIAMTPPFKKGQGDKPKTTSVVNVQLAIEYDPLLKGAFAYNEFTWEVEVVRDIPQLHIKKGQMLDAYTSLILSELETVWDVSFSDRALEHGVIALSRNYGYNPVQNYLNKAEKQWDKQERLETFMPIYLGVEHSEITTLITKLWLVGLCTKAFEPDAKFDYVLDLVGGQGAGKTTLLEKLGGDWYTDQFLDYSDKDSYSNMLRAIIINDDEMTATANASFEELKKFISARKLAFRPAYGHTTIRRDKSFVIARTTNELTYLKDRTGERRFLPLLVNKHQQQKHPVEYLDDDYILQLYGEAMHLYKAGFTFDLTQEQEDMLNEHRSQFMYVDATEESIEHVLATWSADFITSKQIGDNIGAGELVKNKTTAKKIKYVMDNQEDWRPGFKKVGKTSQRGWRRRLQ
ncbi:Helicase [Loigolactobacillus bifermentans DSM 20003]|uniref:Helicase n=2 Tax=Loigolactobacillus bifermentans TaxID=1607 RepID=A0A0R1H7N9_9LACO|nr:Helicase [Loigolactobacillus bifermentans DSM 20003]